MGTKATPRLWLIARRPGAARQHGRLYYGLINPDAFGHIRERNGAINLPRRRPRIGGQVHVSKFGLYAGDSAGARVNVLVQWLGAQRRIRLDVDAIEPVN